MEIESQRQAFINSIPSHRGNVCFFQFCLSVWQIIVGAGRPHTYQKRLRKGLQQNNHWSDGEFFLKQIFQYYATNWTIWQLVNVQKCFVDILVLRVQGPGFCHSYFDWAGHELIMMISGDAVIPSLSHSLSGTAVKTLAQKSAGIFFRTWDNEQAAYNTQLWRCDRIAEWT